MITSFLKCLPEIRYIRMQSYLFKLSLQLKNIVFFPLFFFFLTLITKKIEVENPADNYASWSGVTSAGFSDAHSGL